MKCTIQNTGAMVDDPAVHMLRNGGKDGVSRDGVSLRTGKNGGYQAVNLAIQAGADRIVLLGYDMRYDGSRSHWHAGHPVRVDERWYSEFAKCFSRTTDWGVPIINATPGSALRCFPNMDIDEALRP